MAGVEPAAARGTLRVYLGAAPGVGTTYAALSEARRRAGRGTDVVVAAVDTHGRPRTADLLGGLEVVGVAEVDVAAVLARRPQVAVVDDLARANPPGASHPRRWMDVEALLAAGIDVVGTVDIAEVESLGDVVESITGARRADTVPDAVLRRADQVELIDMSPQALRRRAAHGNVYPPERVDDALAGLFRLGTLTALRELALVWTAGLVDPHRVDAVRLDRAPDRVVVALSGRPEGEVLLRRAALVAERAVSGDVLAVHVLRSGDLAGAEPAALARLRALTHELGGTFHTVTGEDVPTAVIEFARGVDAGQLVVGAGRRGRLRPTLRPGTGAAVVAASGDLDVHVVGQERAARPRPPRWPGGNLERNRVLAGWLVAVLGLPALTVALDRTREHHGLPTVLLLDLLFTVVVALIGGVWPAVATALTAGLLANYLFTEPLHSWAVGQPENALAIIVLVAVAVAVSGLVDRAARITRQAARARAEADTLAMVAGSVIRGSDAVPALMEQLRETFGLDAVALLEPQGSGWAALASAGTDPPADPGSAPVLVRVRDGLVLAATGQRPGPADLRVLTAVALQADAMLERDRLRAAAGAARTEHERASFRAALLAAVSHDLRTPLAAVKAGVSSLRSTDVALPAEDQAELLATVEDGADRLQSLIDNLLDLGRLDAGQVSPHRGDVTLEDVIARAVAPVGEEVVVDVPPALPTIQSDAGLLERVVANLVENAVRHTPEGTPVLVQASATPTEVLVRVADRGPGVAAPDRERMFQAFQRLGDAPGGHGVGLGLAVARGFTEALGGRLHAEDTPGGGLTMVLSLPVSACEEPAEESPPHRRHGEGR